jgi:hypothetical protein
MIKLRPSRAKIKPHAAFRYPAVASHDEIFPAAAFRHHSATGDTVADDDAEELHLR